MLACFSSFPDFSIVLGLEASPLDPAESMNCLSCTGIKAAVENVKVDNKDAATFPAGAARGCPSRRAAAQHADGGRPHTCGHHSTWHARYCCWHIFHLPGTTGCDQLVTACLVCMRGWPCLHHSVLGSQAIVNLVAKLAATGCLAWLAQRSAHALISMPSAGSVMWNIGACRS